MGPFVCAKRASRCRSHDSINSTMVVARPSQPALQLHNRRSIAIALITVSAVSVWVAVAIAAVIAVRVAPAPTPERETKRVNKHEPVADEPVADEASIFQSVFAPIVEKGMAAFKTIFSPIVETVEATKSIIPIEVAAGPTLKAGGGA